jgi:hypothetical protein
MYLHITKLALQVHCLHVFVEQLTSRACTNNGLLQKRKLAYFNTINTDLHNVHLLGSKCIIIPKNFFICFTYNHKKKSKATPVTGRGGPQGCETSRLPHFLYNRLTDGGEVVSLTRRPPYTPQNIPVLIYVRG